MDDRREILDKYGFVVIPKLFSEAMADELRQALENTESTNMYEEGGDGFVRNCLAYPSHPNLLEMLCYALRDMVDTLREPLLPTFAYGRIHKRGAFLPKHKDREACEVSITAHLGGDKDWPIWVKDKMGGHNPISLSKGDGMVYYGVECEHWREPYDGEYYCQAFFHYVKSRGKYFDHYFDLPMNIGSAIGGGGGKFYTDLIQNKESEDGKD
jgi:hypothetical protein